VTNLVLCTVPHTGTQWCVRLLADQGWHELGLNYSGNSHKFPHLYHGHCMKGSQLTFAIERAKRGTPVIMPMRHPYRVQESWRRRDERNMGGLIPTYRNMLEELLPYVRVWLPIDGRPIDQAIAERQLDELTGRTLTYRWHKVVNSKGNTWDMSLAKAEPTEEIREIRSHPVFTQFYGTIEDEDKDRQSEARVWQEMEHKEPSLPDEL